MNKAIKIDQAQQWESIYQRDEQSKDVAWEFVLDIIKEYNIDTSSEILEVGSGVGNNLIALAKMGYTVAGVEISQTAFDKAISRANDAGVNDKCLWVKQSFVSLPFRDEHFGFAFDRGSLMYVSTKEQAKAIAEIHRTLKTGGLFLFTPYEFFSKYDDGKNMYQFLDAVRFLPIHQWRLEKMTRFAVSEIDGEPPVCIFSAIVARKI